MEWLGAGELELGEVALAGGTEFEEGAVFAFGVGEGAEGLGVELDEGVMLIEHGGVPGFGGEAHEAFFGGRGVCAGSQAEALGDAEVVGVDAEGAAAEGGEVDDGGGDLIANAFELLKPGTDFVGAVLGEKVEGEGADAGGDLFEEGFEAKSFLFGKGDDRDGALDGGDGGVADGFPVGGAGVEGALEIAHDLEGRGGFGAGGEKRVDELGEGVPGFAGLGFAVIAKEEAMDVGELVGLLGGEWAASGFEVVRIGEEFGRHVDWMLWDLWWFGKRLNRRGEKSTARAKEEADSQRE